MHPSQIRVLLAGILILLCSLAGGTNAPAQESPPAPVIESFSEQVDIEVVNVDVVVTDRQKRRILDLGKDDFELFVDGRQVAIEYFAHPRAGSPASGAASPAADAAMAAAPAAATPTTAATNLILYIDQTALESQDRKSTLKELREYLAARHEGADRVTVAVFEQRLRLLQTPTTDPTLVAQALDQVEIRPTLAALASRERIQLEHEVRDFGTFGGDPRALEQAILSWGEQRVDLQRRSIAALGQMIDSLAAVEGRKVILLATSGVESNPAQFLLAALDQQRGRLTASGSDRGPALDLAGQTLLEEFEAMIRSAQNARATLYGISPVVRPPVQGGAELRSSGPGAARPLPHDFGPAEAAASIARLTEATGGGSFTIWGDLDQRLEGVSADIDAAYSLGFSAGVAEGEGDHRIEVRIQGKDLDVRHRESYRRSSAPDRAAAALTAAATLGQSENPLEITLSLGEGRPDGQKRSGETVPIAVGIPLRSVSLVPAGDARRGSVSVRVSIQDARGRLLESGTTVVPIVVPEGDIEKALAATWYHRAEVRLAPGHQRVAVVVLDEISGVQSTAFAELEIP